MTVDSKEILGRVVRRFFMVPFCFCDVRSQLSTSCSALLLLLSPMHAARVGARARAGGAAREVGLPPLGALSRGEVCNVHKVAEASAGDAQAPAGFERV